MNFNSLFTPQSIALIGASREETSVGHALFQNLITGSYQGKVYPVNPKATEILGKQCFPNLQAISDPIDMVIIAVPATIVQKVAEEAVQRKAIFYDKKGDCEAHHEWLEEQGIRSIAPVRKNGKRGKLRRRLMKSFPQKTYNKRNRNENVNYVFKNKNGDSLSAYTVVGRRAEIATKVLCHNLWARLKSLLDELFNNATAA